MLTVKQYQEVLPQIGLKQKSILAKFYLHGPFATRKLMAEKLSFAGYGETNLHLGTLGKLISQLLKVEPETSYKRGSVLKPAYYSLVYDEQTLALVPNLRTAIETLEWEIEDDSIDHLPTEEVKITNTLFKDGKVIQVWVNRYERDIKARKIAEQLHGRTCVGCNIDFKKTYGDDINHIIHFHHVRALGKLKKEEVKDVAKDLVPLCPNCHSVVHSRQELMSIEELRKRTQRKN